MNSLGIHSASFPDPIQIFQTWSGNEARIYQCNVCIQMTKTRSIFANYNTVKKFGFIFATSPVVHVIFFVLVHMFIHSV